MDTTVSQEDTDKNKIDSALDTAYNYVVSRGFPYYEYSKEERVVQFNKIKNFDTSTVVDGDVVRQTMHGLGLAWSYFPHSWTVRTRNMKTPMDIYSNSVLLKKAIHRRLSRGGFVMLREDGTMTDSQIRKAIRSYSGVQSVSNFRPTAASAIYKHLGGGVVWDMSSGFGGRLLGALSSGVVKKYIGTDPSSPTFDGLCKIRDDFSYTGMAVELNKCGSENFIPSEPVDICFTSPPYFNTEKYTDEETQSWISYKSENDWNELFLRKTIKNCFACLKPSGCMAVNIANVLSHKTLEQDTVRIAKEEGFNLLKTMRLQLSSIRNGGFKYEPIFVFDKQKT